MLTRLKVKGFKNLYDVDIRFGPFTCIAGENGVGKSNVFDAIQFLSYLADKTLLEAADSVRRNNSNFKGSTVKNIFHQTGSKTSKRMTFEVEMIIPKEGEDELGQLAEASFNFLSYVLILELIDDESFKDKGAIRIIKEELKPIGKKISNKHILFNHKYSWRNSIIAGRRSVEFISTKIENGEPYINLHQDGGSSGKPKPFQAKNLPRTVLSTANYGSETPTVLLAKREFQSWKMLQLEPSSLRNPDDLDKYTSNIKLGMDGSHLAATIYRLASNGNSPTGHNSSNSVYTALANRLSELINDVKEIFIDRDDKRQLLTLQVVGRDNTRLPASSLSDGTLRFLALAVLNVDFTETGLICLEEPENGIHPERIPAIIELLRSIPVDPDDDDTEDNPLRQVIINTHSPSVVMEVPDYSLIYAELQEFINDGIRFRATSFKALENTWRTNKAGYGQVKKAKLLSYLNPGSIFEDENNENNFKKIKGRKDLSILNQTKLNFNEKD